MTDDPQLLAKRVAYVKTVRGLYRNERIAGLVGSLVGALLLIWGRMGQDAPAWAVPVAFLVIGTAWRRANPFNPEA